MRRDQNAGSVKSQYLSTSDRQKLTTFSRLVWAAWLAGIHCWHYQCDGCRRCESSLSADLCYVVQPVKYTAKPSETSSYRLSQLILTDLLSSELSAPWLVASMANWVTSQRTIQFAAANHSGNKVSWEAEVTDRSTLLKIRCLDVFNTATEYSLTD